MKIKVDEIGFLTLGTKVHVSDPCYETNCWCAGTLSNMFSGKYRCMIERCDDDCCQSVPETFDRVKSIAIFHEQYDIQPAERVPFEVGVDSGQAGFYDETYYRRFHKELDGTHCNEQWYGRVCASTLANVPNQHYVKEIDFLRSALPHLTEEQLQDAVNNAPGFTYKSDVLEAKIKYLKSPDIAWKTIQVGYAGILDDKCCVASSGYGDGGYDCLIGRNDKGQIVSAKIEFISDDKE